MRRRQFLIGSTSAALWLRCGGSTPSNGDPDATPGGADADPAAPDAAACTMTESNIEGPFYKEGAPSRMVLIDDDTPGTRLTVSGRVVAAGSCAALSGARLDVWHADDQGTYDTDGFRLRGTLAAAEGGGYEFLTIVPGRYLNGDTYRPAHIHVKVSAPGYPELTTQLYFAGDPFNEGDPFIRDSLVMAPTENPDGSLAARFDFALAAV